jgi:hypothetical protein
LIKKAAVIRRRSGVEKFEIDLRRAPFRLAPRPVPLTALIFVSAAMAGAAPTLRPVPWDVVTRRLAATQRYAAGQPGWREFLRAAKQLPAFELRRGRHAAQSAEAVKQLLTAERLRL